MFSFNDIKIKKKKNRRSMFNAEKNVVDKNLR